MMKRIALKWRIVAAFVLLLAGWCGYSALKSAFDTPPVMWTAPQGQITWLGQWTYDNDKITVRVGSANPTGNRIADIVPVRVLIVADPGVQIDLSGLLGGTLSQTNGNSYYDYSGSYGPGLAYGHGSSGPPSSPDTTPDFQLAAPPVVTQFDSHGKRVWQIDLSVRAFKVKPALAFVMDFRYADSRVGDDWYWNDQTTDRAWIQTTLSAAEKDQFDPGSNALRHESGTPIAWPLIGGGFALLLVLIGRSIFQWPARVRARWVMTAEARTWKQFDAAFKSGKDGRWTVAEYMRIAGALRAYLGLPVQTTTQMEAMDDLSDKDVVVRVFKLLEGAMYGRTEPSSSDMVLLRDWLERIVPRPTP